VPAFWMIEIGRYLQDGEERKGSPEIFARLCFSLCAAGLLTAIADAAQIERLIFLSTQLRRSKRGRRMRNLILRFPRAVDYITEQPQHFHCASRQSKGGTHPSMSSALAWRVCSRSCR